jgi:hypothetical protein
MSEWSVCYWVAGTLPGDDGVVQLPGFVF